MFLGKAKTTQPSVICKTVGRDDKKKGGHGQQLFRILLKVIMNYLNTKPVRVLFYLFKISINHILVRLGSTCLASGFRASSAGLLTSLVLGGLGIHDLSQLV